MSTRAAIAKPQGDAWEGTYHHSDGYPTGLGRFLHAAYHDQFGGDLDAMTAKLVDGERIGWSFIIDRDLSLPAQWSGAFGGSGEPNGPESYTARGETGEMRLDPDAPADIEWAYVLTPAGIAVYGGGYRRDFRSPIGFVRWDDPPARMSEIEEAA